MSSRVKWLIVLLLLVGCGGETQVGEEINGRVLIWHTFDASEEAVFDQLLSNFAELHPEVRITDERFSAEALEQTFPEQAASGLGPDIVILPTAHINELVDAGLIRDIRAALGEDGSIHADQFLTSALDTVRDGEQVYGLPLSLSTFGLYYNKALLGEEPTDSATISDLTTVLTQQPITDTAALEALVNETEPILPATDLEQLLQQANSGQRVAMLSTFYDAFWGVQAFGGQLFDEEGRVLLNQGGFANWLSWLKRAQLNPNIILSQRDETLFDLFTQGETTYYIGRSDTLPILQEAMGAENVGVVRLPSLQGKAAGPFLEVNALLFSEASAANSADAALHLGQFLTSTEQQTELALVAGQIPANHHVQIDPRVAPLVAEFVAQSRTSIPISLSNRGRVNEIIALGDTLYGQVLVGEATVVAAANDLTEQINSNYGLESLATSEVTEDCALRGAITVWHPYADSAETTLTAIRDDFTQACSGTTITLERFERAELVDIYANAVAAGRAPDLVLGTNRDVVHLANDELIMPITDALDSDFVQRYAHGLEQETRFGDDLYGVPIALNTMTLYYNSDLIQDPPVVLDDILIAANNGVAIGIPLGFEESYWGISAFGATVNSPLFDADGRVTLQDVGLSGWLEWLQSANSRNNIVINRDRSILREQFAAQELALLVEDARHLPVLQETVGADKLSVALLPTGRPLLEVDLLMLNALVEEEAREVALTFAKSLTDVDNQTRLAQEAALIPVNINVTTSDLPLVDGFVHQSDAAVVLPNNEATEIVLNSGDLVYEEVVENGIDPISAADDFANIIDVALGFEVVEATETTECEDTGQVSLWHSWDETATFAWQQIISGFVTLCPNIELMTTFVPEAELADALAETVQPNSEVSPPDFFIGRHDDLQNYIDLGLARNINGIAAEHHLTDYLPRSLRAFTQDDALYGLPQYIDMQAIFYRSDVVQEPPQTLEQMLAQVNSGTRIGFSDTLEDMLWGGAAFGCEPCRTGTFFDEQGNVLLTEAVLAGWFEYLQALAQSGNARFATDDEALIAQLTNGELAYIVTNTRHINRLWDAVGVANLSIAPLPVGANEQVTTPYGLVHGFVFSAVTTESNALLALRFADYATSRESQALLMQVAHYVPTHNLVLISADVEFLQPLSEELPRMVLMPASGIRQQLREQTQIAQQFEALINDGGQP